LSTPPLARPSTTPAEKERKVRTYVVFINGCHSVHKLLWTQVLLAGLLVLDGMLCELGLVLRRYNGVDLRADQALFHALANVALLELVLGLLGYLGHLVSD
jgi:hypothetical protein